MDRKKVEVLYVEVKQKWISDKYIRFLLIFFRDSTIQNVQVYLHNNYRVFLERQKERDYRRNRRRNIR